MLISINVNKRMNLGYIVVFKKIRGPRSVLALKGLSVLSVAQRSVSLLGDADTHASVK